MITLNRTQAAAFLNMHPVTLLQKVHAGIIPAAKPAKSWVFIQQDLLDYLRGLYSTKNHNTVTETKNNQPNISDNVTVTNKGFGVKKAYYQLLGIDDCPQIHSPKPDRVVANATRTKRIRSRSEAVGLVVNSLACQNQIADDVRCIKE